MSATLSPGMEALKARLKATWMSGDYGHFAKYLEPGALEILARLAVAPGIRMLDLACGAGQIAIPAARTGVQVTGVDIAGNLIEQARTRAEAEGMRVRFDEGDAEDSRRWMMPIAVAILLLGGEARADVVTEWNTKAGEIVVAAKLGPPPANRVLAIVQTAVYEAANAISNRYPGRGLKLEGAAGASVDAAIASANHAALAKLVPSQQAAIDGAYQTGLAKIAEGPAKTAGITVGEKAAAAILAARADDGASLGETYRPHATAGVYVPTALPAVPQWPQRKPWLMKGPAEFRPGPPAALTSELWARDYSEIRELGSKNSTRRTAEQTEIARFWEDTLPPIYHGLVRSVANAPGRDLTRNACLFAAATQATDDALIAVFDAKYHYNFWRPFTAIRNGDIDGNDATERDPTWTPFIDTPMHPEYPCAHCIVAGAVGTVLQAEIGAGPAPALSTVSATARTTRSWATLEDFMREVANARIYDGVHYRNSTEVGTTMGRKIGELAVAKFSCQTKQGTGR